MPRTFKVGDVVCLKDGKRTSGEEITMIITGIKKDNRNINMYEYKSLLEHRLGFSAYGRELSKSINPDHLEYVYSKVRFPEIVSRLEEAKPELKNHTVEANDMVWALIMNMDEAFFKWINEYPNIKPKQSTWHTMDTWLDTFLLTMSVPACNKKFETLKKLVELGEKIDIDSCKLQLLGIRKGDKIAEAMYQYLSEKNPK